MPLPIRLTPRAIFFLLLLAGPAAAQEDPQTPPVVPPERSSTILVHPDNQGVVAVSNRTQIVFVNLSRSQDATLRYFWIFNADVSPVGTTLTLRGGDTKTLVAIKQGFEGKTIGPETLLVFNNGSSTVALHKIGD
jgi:hypothetical protein